MTEHNGDASGPGSQASPEAAGASSPSVSIPIAQRVLFIGVPIRLRGGAQRLAERYERGDMVGREPGHYHCIVYATEKGDYAVWHSTNQITVKWLS